MAAEPLSPAQRTALEALQAWVELSRPTLLNGRTMCDAHTAAEQALAALAAPGTPAEPSGRQRQFGALHSLRVWLDAYRLSMRAGVQRDVLDEQIDALNEVIEVLSPRGNGVLAAEPSGPVETPTHEGTCNPTLAPCGARFCTYEDMAAHMREHGESWAAYPLGERPTEPTP